MTDFIPIIDIVSLIIYLDTYCIICSLAVQIFRDFRNDVEVGIWPYEGENVISPLIFLGSWLRRHCDKKTDY